MLKPTKPAHQQVRHHPEAPGLAERRNGRLQTQSCCQLGNDTTKNWVLSYNNKVYALNQETKYMLLPSPQSKHTGLVIKG